MAAIGSAAIGAAIGGGYSAAIGGGYRRLLSSAATPARVSLCRVRPSAVRARLSGVAVWLVWLAAVACRAR